MPEEILQTEDSTGATEVDSPEMDTSQETDTSTEEVAETTTTEPDLYEIEDIQATAAQLREWKEAFETKQSKDKDYTQKTQTLAEQRKAFQERESVLQQQLDIMDAVAGDIESILLGDLSKVDLDKVLEEYGTDEYLKTQREIERRRGAATNIAQRANEVMEKRLNEAKQTLYQDLGWSDSDKQKADIAAVESYVRDSGMPQKDYMEVKSPYVMKALLEAQKYRELMKKREDTSKQVRQAAKVAKPAQHAQQSKPKSLAERMYGKK